MLTGMLIRMHAGCVVMHHHRVMNITFVRGVVRYSMPDIHARRSDRQKHQR